MDTAQTDEDPFYITGGTLPPDADSYVVRRADAQLLQELRRGQFCYVLNTRQMGKSSLMVRTARQLREEGCRVVILDLTAIGQNLTIDQWYYGLLVQTADQTGTRAEMLAFWKSNRELGPMQRYIEAVRYVLLERNENASPFARPATLPSPPSLRRFGAGNIAKPPDERLVIFVDEIDVVRSLPFSVDEFFAGIRECYNRRPQSPLFERLTFCLLGVAAPTDLVQDTRISPFNIGTRIDLGDFSPEEAARLATGLLPPPDKETSPETALSATVSKFVARHLLSRILYWTNGHPYMTQRLCQALAQENLDSGLSDIGIPFAITAARRVDRLCHDLFLSKRAQEVDDNLTFVRNRLLHSEADSIALLDFYREALRGRRRIYNDAANPLCSILLLSGVVAASQEWLVRRNRIYENVFNNAWIDTHMPGAELRRQREAFRRGAVRVATAGGSALLAVGVLAGVAVNRALVARRASEQATAASTRASTQEALSRARLSRAYVDQGRRLMDAGDASGALALFAEAMRLDADNPVRTAQHRLRIGAALALCPSLTYLWSTDKPLRCATFSPDKTRIAAVGDDGHIYLWDVTSQETHPTELPTAPLPGRERAPINFVAFSADGARLVTCHDDGCARVWDVRPGERRLLYTLPQAAQADGNRRVREAAWSGDGRHIAFVGGAHTEVWKLPATETENSEPERIETDYTPSAQYTHVAFSPNGSQFAVGSLNFIGFQMGVPDQNRIQRLATQTLGGNYVTHHIAYSRDGNRILVAGTFGGKGEHPGACLLDARIAGAKFLSQQSPLLPTGEIARYATFSPDEKRIATTSEDGTVRVWDAASGKPLSPPIYHASYAVEVEFSPDGKRLVTAGMDGTARIWDAATGAPICAPLHHASAVLTARFGIDSDHVMTASRDGSVRLWALPSQSTNTPFLQLSEYVTTFADTTRAAVISHEKGLSIWDLQTGKKRFLSAGDALTPFHYVEDSGDYLLCSGLITLGMGNSPTAQFYFQVWNWRTEQAVTPYFQAHRAFLSHQGKHLILNDANGTARLLHLDRKAEPILFKNILPQNVNSSYNSSPFSPNDRAFLSCETETSLSLRDVDTGAPLTPRITLNAPLRQWEFSPDGQFLFTWTESKTAGSTLQIWKTSNGTQASVLSPFTGIATDNRDTSHGLRFSTYGNLALSRSEATVYFWRLYERERLRPQSLALPQTANLRFSPDERFFAAIGQSTWLWNTDPHTPAPVALSPDSGLKVSEVAFSPDSRKVIAAYEDGATILYDAQTGTPVTRPLPFSRTRSLAFCSEGKLVATGSSDGAVRIWDAATGEALSPVLQAAGSVYALHFSPDGKRLIAAVRHRNPAGLFTTVWNIPATTLSPARIAALSTLLSGQQTNDSLGPILASPDATRAAWKVWQDAK